MIAAMARSPSKHGKMVAGSRTPAALHDGAVVTRRRPAPAGKSGSVLQPQDRELDQVVARRREEQAPHHRDREQHREAAVEDGEARPDARLLQEVVVPQIHAVRHDAEIDDRSPAAGSGGTTIRPAGRTTAGSRTNKATNAWRKLRAYARPPLTSTMRRGQIEPERDEQVAPDRDREAHVGVPSEPLDHRDADHPCASSTRAPRRAPCRARRCRGNPAASAARRPGSTPP